MNLRLRLLVGWLSVILLACALTARAQIDAFGGPNGTLCGTVLFTADNRPAEGVKVDAKVLTGGQVATVLTGSIGEFCVAGLHSGMYIISVEESGYEPIRETVDLGFQPGVVLYLKKTNRFLSSQTGSTVSVRELSIPPKARKAFQKGLARLAKKDPAGSLAHFKQAATLWSNYYEAYYEMGVAEMILGRKGQAEQAFQESIDLSGGHYIESELALGLLLCQRGEFAAAETIVRRALELDANSWAGHYLLARALLGLDRLDEAEKSASKVIWGKPDFAPAHLLLAQTHIRRGDYATAVKDLNAYLKLEPTGPLSANVRQIRERVERTLSKLEKTSESPAKELTSK
jgi:tetratricopeptide (TPR) repeat protein